MYRLAVGLYSTISICLLLIFTFLIILTPSIGYASPIKIVGDESGIKFVGGTPDLSIGNMEPGLSVTRQLTIANNGSDSFPFHITAAVEGGDAEMLSWLDFVVWGDGQEFYNGPVDGLEAVSLNDIASNETNIYHLTVSIPEEAGNELQGASLALKFTFYSHHQAPEPGGDLPITGTNVMWLIPLGLLVLYLGFLLARKRQAKNRCTPEQLR